MLLLQLFALQFEYGFMSSLKWISPAENVVADAISRPSREAIIRIAPAAFRAIWDEMGPFRPHGVHGVGAAIPGTRGGTTIFLLVRLRRLCGNGFVGAGCVDRTG